MLIFKSSQVIKYYVMFAFLFVQTVCSLSYGLLVFVGFVSRFGFDRIVILNAKVQGHCLGLYFTCVFSISPTKCEHLGEIYTEYNSEIKTGL